MKNKNWLNALPQSFSACVPGLWVTVFGGLLLFNPVFLVIGALLTVIPAAIVIIRHVAGG